MHFPACLPVRAPLLELYVASVGARLRADTIRSYISALAFFQAAAGFPPAPFAQPRLRLLLRGVRRLQRAAPGRPLRLPITTRHLSVAFDFARHSLSPYDALVFRAAFSLAFFGLFRVSEFCCPGPRTFRPAADLGLGDLAFDLSRGIARIRLKVSKTDPFGRGCVVRLFRTNGALCPFSALLRYYSLRRARGPGPLFVLSDGRFLTRALVVGFLRAAFPHIPPSRLSSHSFRIGGASRLCALGTPDATIQAMGRWSSAAFRRYLRLSNSLVHSLHARMSFGP